MYIPLVVMILVVKKKMRVVAMATVNDWYFQIKMGTNPNLTKDAMNTPMTI